MDLVQEDGQSCLIVLMNQMYYGIKTSFVKEIIELPELSSLPHFPSAFAGVLDYRGVTVPILDAKLALGFEEEQFSETDIIVILQEAGELFGLILPAITDIQNIYSVKEAHFFQFIISPLTPLPIIKEVSKYRDHLVFMFDVKALFAELNALFSTDHRHLQEQVGQTVLEGRALSDQKPAQKLFLSRIPEHLKGLFAERTKRISEGHFMLGTPPGSLSMTILKIHGKRFAIESEKIKEFCYISEYATIPSHEKLVGFMSLRGAILPLADMWYLLHGEKLTIKPLCKVLVLDFEEGMFGFIVEEAERVAIVNVSAFCELPFDTAAEEEPFIKQAVKVDNKVIGVLDTEKLIQAVYDV